MAAILMRGQYDRPGDKVEAAFPAFLPSPATTSTNRLTRLDLARWLASPQHPLTARVAVNRFWAMVFGTGLVKTVNDFGSQGEWPSHPELLNWLAADFARDWDVKRVLKQMVMSHAFRQSAAVTPALLAKDSENRLLARGPRARLDAEFVRDNALAIAGLLNPQLGGKPVYPYQPPGVWEINEMGGGGWKQQRDASQYRRALYIYHRRSTPYPSLLTFDAPNREVCAAGRAQHAFIHASSFGHRARSTDSARNSAAATFRSATLNSLPSRYFDFASAASSTSKAGTTSSQAFSASAGLRSATGSADVWRT